MHLRLPPVPGRPPGAAEQSSHPALLLGDDERADVVVVAALGVAVTYDSGALIAAERGERPIGPAIVPCCSAASYRQSPPQSWPSAGEAHPARCSATRWLGMSASRWVGMTGDGKGPAGGVGGVGGALWCPGCRGGGRVVVVSRLRGRSACPPGRRGHWSGSGSDPYFVMVTSPCGGMRLACNDRSFWGVIGVLPMRRRDSW